MILIVCVAFYQQVNLRMMVSVLRYAHTDLSLSEQKTSKVRIYCGVTLNLLAG